MAFLVTRGLGRSTIGQDTTFVVTRGLGRGQQAVPGGEGKSDSYRFHDHADYLGLAKREDEELLVICRGFVEMICR